jgi:hypothetical protein
MPRFYFHLCAPDQIFADMGSDLSDLSAAHARALLLADRVMMMFGFADRTSDFRRWTVDVIDEKHRSLITVKFRSTFRVANAKPWQIEASALCSNRLTRSCERRRR